MHLVKAPGPIRWASAKKDWGTHLTSRSSKMDIESQWAGNTASVEEYEVSFSTSKCVAPNDAQESNSNSKESRIKKTLVNQDKCYCSRVQC